MDYKQIQNIYFLTLFSYLIVEVVLLVLNKRSALQPKGELPESLLKLQTGEVKDKSTKYTCEKINLNIIQTVYSGVLIFIAIYFGLFGAFDNWLRGYVESFYLRGSLFIVGISFIFSLFSLPLSLYSTFVIEEKYGFNKSTFKLWTVDLIKSTALSLLLSVPLLIAVLYFIETFPEYWWAYVFILISSFQILIMLIYPIWIAPLFNTFKVLEDKNLLEDINKLADSLSFESQGIFQMDASKRSSHGNAYFAGFGKFRRIVIFDTLIKSLTNKELCAVLAHEIGHAKKHHVLKSVLLSMLFLLVALYCAFLLLQNREFFMAFGIANPSSYALLLLFCIAFEPIIFFITPFFSMFSRRNEYEADRFAVDAMQGASDLENALAKLSTESLSNLSPHPWYSFFHYSHPVLVERIRAMNGYFLSK